MGCTVSCHRKSYNKQYMVWKIFHWQNFSRQQIPLGNHLGESRKNKFSLSLSLSPLVSFSLPFPLSLPPSLPSPLLLQLRNQLLLLGLEKNDDKAQQFSINAKMLSWTFVLKIWFLKLTCNAKKKFWSFI